MEQLKKGSPCSATIAAARCELQIDISITSATLLPSTVLQCFRWLLAALQTPVDYSRFQCVGLSASPSSQMGRNHLAAWQTPELHESFCELSELM